MKKWIALLLCLLLFGLSACGSPDTGPDTADPSGGSTAQTPESNPESEPEPAPEPEPASEPGSGKVLVAYFSASGNTEHVAQVIAGTLEGDLFELVPAEPYTTDDLNYNDPDSRVSREHDDPGLQNIELAADTVSNWEEYDTVFIGYPIWWGGAAWPVNTFAANNDFTGKTVVPFCTSASSGLGESDTLLQEAAGTGTWLAGQRFAGRAAESEITDWLNGLGGEGTAE